MSEQNSIRFVPTAAGLVLALACGLTGCQLWPFDAKERTTVITPAMRVSSIREIGARGRGVGETEQANICEQLAHHIQSEPDPIVRKAIQETIAQFKTPLSSVVIVAGLSDDASVVRMSCCRLLGDRAEAASISQLGRVAAADADVDVRMAAVDALGKFKSPASVQALAVALKDRDPAMQLAGMEAMKSASGEDLGNDVQTWRTYAARIGGAGESPVDVATQPGAVGAAVK